MVRQSNVYDKAAASMQARSAEPLLSGGTVEGIVYRSLIASSDRPGSGSASTRRHSLLALLRLRPVLAQHTREENDALRKWANARKALVEIGVAEGASALTLRQVMAKDGTLYLVDPFHLSRMPLLNSMKRLAKRTVARCRTGHVIWIREFSSDAVERWKSPIDFLFLDGDHNEQVVCRDWNAWSPFVTPGGIVALHDARVFAGGWTTATDGPVRLVDKVFRQSENTKWTIVDEVHSLVVVRRCE